MPEETASTPQEAQETPLIDSPPEGSQDTAPQGDSPDAIPFAGRPVEELSPEEIDRLSDQATMDLYLASLRPQPKAGAAPQAESQDAPAEGEAQVEEDPAVRIPDRVRILSWPEKEQIAVQIKAARGCSLAEALRLAGALDDEAAPQKAEEPQPQQPQQDPVEAARQRLADLKVQLAEAKASFADETEILMAIADASTDLKFAIAEKRDAEKRAAEAETRDRAERDAAFERTLAAVRQRFPDATVSGTPLNAKIVEVLDRLEADPHLESIFYSPNYPMMVAAIAADELRADAAAVPTSATTLQRAEGAAANVGRQHPAGGNGSTPPRVAARPVPVGPGTAGSTPPLSREQFLRRLDEITDPEELDRLVSAVGTRPDAVLRRGR